MQHRPSRVIELKRAIDTILHDGFIVPAKLPSILGKLQHADSHVWGRAGRCALADLREMGHASLDKKMLDPTMVSALNILNEKWQAKAESRVIGLVELYACVVATLHWKHMVDTKRLILFVDNWPALDVLVKGTFQADWRDLEFLSPFHARVFIAVWDHRYLLGLWL